MNAHFSELKEHESRMKGSFLRSEQATLHDDDSTTKKAIN